MASNIRELKRLDLLNIVNTAQGSKFGQVGTAAEFYKEIDAKFYGIPAADLTGFQISDYFHGTANFIDEALERNGKLLI